MTPRIFGVVVVGTGSPLISMGRFMLISLLKVVKSVADDFGAESCKFLDLNQSSSESRYGFSLSHMGWIVVPELKMLVSSAYVMTFMDSGGVGMFFSCTG